MSDYTPTVVGVRGAYSRGADPVFSEDGRRTDYRTQRQMYEEFDRWLAEHDKAVLTRWEMTRKPDPIIIENIQGEPAAAWMERQRREAKAEAWDEGRATAIADIDTTGYGGMADTPNPYRSEL